MFKKSPRTFSGFLWCLEQKSEYRGNHSGQFKGGGTASLFLGTLVTFTTISLIVQKRAFFANETDERKKRRVRLLQSPYQIAQSFGRRPN